ncbi:hypothetical protein HJB89_31160 [Rhizobium sp. NZLR8]|uniref:hypothetical protein n=1 Tax=Rhizobium sp. NZLR8 TaxID=2731104 RepID=UPI001C828F40|nr:hypothetical protein [Rhizobium sp. NZLR8]MBX5161514.1 hypothetical protein [Rhizobium sp. NZLR8]
MKQLAATFMDKAGQYLSKIGERLILLQSTGLAAVAMLVSYAYGRANYTPAGTQCAPYSKFMQFDPSTCHKIPAVIVYPEPWLDMLVAAIVGTVILGMIAATMDRSVFVRYLFCGWLTFCAVIAVSGYFNYSGMGQFPSAYFVVYPATPVIAFGVAAAGVASIANVVLRIRANLCFGVQKLDADKG